MELFITDEFEQYDFVQTMNNYISQGWTPTTYVEVIDSDFYTTELQLQHLIFNEKLERCETCQ